MVLNVKKQKKEKKSWMNKLGFFRKSKSKDVAETKPVTSDKKITSSKVSGGHQGARNEKKKKNVENSPERRSPTNITVTSSQESTTQNDRDAASDGSVPDTNDDQPNIDTEIPLNRKKSVSFRLPSESSLTSEEDPSAAVEESAEDASAGKDKEEESLDNTMGDYDAEDVDTNSDSVPDTPQDKKLDSAMGENEIEDVGMNPASTQDTPEGEKPGPAIQEINGAKETDEVPTADSNDTEVVTVDSIDDEEEEIQKKIQAIKDEMGNIQEKLADISKEMEESSKSSVESMSSGEDSGKEDDGDEGSLMGFLLSPFKDTSGVVQFGASGVDMKAGTTKSMQHPLVPVWQAKSEGAVIPKRYVNVEDQGDDEESALKVDEQDDEETDPIGQVELVNFNLDEGEDAIRRQLESLPRAPSMADDASQASSTFLIPVYSDSFDHASVGPVPDTIQKYESTNLYLKMLPPIKETSVDEAMSAAESLFSMSQGVDWKGAGNSMKSGLNAFLGGVEEVSESVVKNTLLYDVIEGVDKKGSKDNQ